MKIELWKINVMAFTMLLLCAAGGAWLQLERQNRTFIAEASDHARLAADIMLLNTDNAIIAENILKDIFMIFLGNTAKFADYLERIEPFKSEELEAFAIESGLAGIGVIRSSERISVFGPEGWQRLVPDKLECGRKGSMTLYPAVHLMVFISAEERGICLAVAADSSRLEKLKASAGIERTLERISGLEGVKSVSFKPESPEASHYREFKKDSENVVVEFSETKKFVSAYADIGSGRLTVEMDMEPLYRIRATTMFYFIFFGLGLFLTGLLLTWIVYRYQRAYIKQLRAFEKDLARQSEDAALGRSAAAVAHEIRNPLNSVAMGLQSLKMAPAGNKHNSLIDIMLSEIKRANGILSQMLSFSASYRPVKVTIHLGNVLKNQVLLFESQLKSKNIKVLFNIEDLAVQGDPSLLSQVFSNLISNAINAQQEGGFIDFFLKKQGGQICFEMRNGGNLPDTESMKRLFEPYFSTGTRGTGLGLAICQKIVEAHGWSIEAVVTEDYFSTQIIMANKKVKTGEDSRS